MVYYSIFWGIAVLILFSLLVQRIGKLRTANVRLTEAQQSELLPTDAPPKKGRRLWLFWSDDTTGKYRTRLLYAAIFVIACILIILGIIYLPEMWAFTTPLVRDAKESFPTSQRILWLLGILLAFVLVILSLYLLLFKRKVSSGLLLLLFALIAAPYLPYILNEIRKDFGNWVEGPRYTPAGIVYAPAKPSWYDTLNTLMATPRDWTNPVRVEGDRCIQWWGVHPDGDAFIVQVRGINDQVWYNWEAWKQLKRDGYIPYNFGWVRFKATRNQTIVSYKFLSPGMCN